jgi:type I restriction enzyme, S subunit
MSNYVPLAYITQINPRLPQNLDESQNVSFVAMASVSEDGRILKQDTRTLGNTKKGYTYFQRGDILLAKITPCFENGKAALANNLEHPIGFGSTEFHVLRPIPQQLDAQYLFYMVWSDRFRFLGQKVMKGAAGQKRVPADFLKSFEIPLPSPDDQKRIAYLLSKVKGAIAQRKQHLQQLDDLLKSVFLEMFGDPVRNEKGWATKTLGKLEPSFKYGTNVKSVNDANNGFPILRIPNVVGGKIDLTDIKYSNLDEAELAKTQLITGDLLLVRTNGNPEYIGRSAVFDITEGIYAYAMMYPKNWAME